MKLHCTPIIFWKVYQCKDTLKSTQQVTDGNLASMLWVLTTDEQQVNDERAWRWWSQARPVPLVPKYVSYVAAGTLVQSVAASTSSHNGSVQSAVVITSHDSSVQSVVASISSHDSGVQSLAANALQWQLTKLAASIIVSSNQQSSASASSHDTDNSQV